MASLKLEPAESDIAVGTEVIRIDDFGHPHLTRTRSQVWEVCGHLSVKVEGVSGSYILERIFVMPKRETEP